jgi:cAMP-dependent protein kinase regulator
VVGVIIFVSFFEWILIRCPLLSFPTELSLLRLAPRAATVSAVIRRDPTQPKLKVAELNASSFTRLLGPLRELMERHAGTRYSMGPRMSIAR